MVSLKAYALQCYGKTPQGLLPFFETLVVRLMPQLASRPTLALLWENVSLLDSVF